MRVMIMALRSHGYTLFQAVDGGAALEVAVKEKPDLIIMDIRLPKIDGVDVTRRLRRMPEFNATPIIAVTAYAMKGDRGRFLTAGCAAYISKPVDTRQLPKVVSDILRSRRQKSPLCNKRYHIGK